jgi:hypothetical protein
MAHVGRRPWSNRLTVEDCWSWDTAALRRAGVFRAAPETLCATTWKDRDGKELFQVTFCLVRSNIGKLTLHVRYGPPTGTSSPVTIPSESIELEETRCHLGGSRCWFRCPRLRYGVPCRRRVRILYCPSDQFFGCRACHNLTYRSCREHDERREDFLKLPSKEFSRILTGEDLRKSLLAVKAIILHFGRLQRKATHGRFLSLPTQPVPPPDSPQKSP